VELGIDLTGHDSCDNEFTKPAHKYRQQHINFVLQLLRSGKIDTTGCGNLVAVRKTQEKYLL
jgi:hypothetical protein